MSRAALRTGGFRHTEGAGIRVRRRLTLLRTDADELSEDQNNLVDVTVDELIADVLGNLAGRVVVRGISDAFVERIDRVVTEAEVVPGLLADENQRVVDAVGLVVHELALGGTNDRRVVRARKTTVATDDDIGNLANRLGRFEQRVRCTGAALGEVLDDTGDTSRIRPRFVRPSLRFGNPGRCDEFHCTSDLLRALNARNSALEYALFRSRNGSALRRTRDVSLGKCRVAVDHAHGCCSLSFSVWGVDASGAAGRFEFAGEAGNDRLEFVNVDVAGALDAVEHAAVAGADELKEFGFEAVHVGHRNGVEVATGTGEERNNLLFDRHWRVDALLEQARRSHHDHGVLHGADLFERRHCLRNGRCLLTNSDIDALHTQATLVDDRVERNRGLASLTVANDQLSLATADRDQRVDRLDAGLHWFMHGLATHDARCLDFHTTGLGAHEGALAVDGFANGVDHTAEQSVANRHRQNVAGGTNGLAFGNLVDLTEHNGADGVFVEVSATACTDDHGHEALGCLAGLAVEQVIHDLDAALGRNAGIADCGAELVVVVDSSADLEEFVADASNVAFGVSHGEHGVGVSLYAIAAHEGLLDQRHCLDPEESEDDEECQGGPEEFPRVAWNKATVRAFCAKKGGCEQHVTAPAASVDTEPLAPASAVVRAASISFWAPALSWVMFSSTLATASARSASDSDRATSMIDAASALAAAIRSSCAALSWASSDSESETESCPAVTLARRASRPSTIGGRSTNFISAQSAKKNSPDQIISGSVGRIGLNDPSSASSAKNIKPTMGSMGSAKPALDAASADFKSAALKPSAWARTVARVLIGIVSLDDSQLRVVASCDLLVGRAQRLVSRVQRRSDVYGSQDGEHESLDEADADLEAGEGDQANEGAEPCEWLDDEAGEAVEELGEGADGQHTEGHEQNVTGEHVGEESNCVAERAGNEDREELDEADEAPHERVLDAWGPDDVLEVLEAVVLDADGNEHCPDGERHDQRCSHASVERHVEERDDLEEVADRNEQEQRGQQRHVGLVANTNAGLGDLFFDELDDAFGEHPNLGWLVSGTATSHQEDDGRDQEGDQLGRTGLESRVRKAGGDVSKLPEQQSQVRNNDGHAERNQIDPCLVAHQDHDSRDDAETDQETKHGAAGQCGERNSGRDLDDPGRQPHVDEHEAKAEGDRSGAVGSPDEVATDGCIDAGQPIDHQCERSRPMGVGRSAGCFCERREGFGLGIVGDEHGDRAVSRTLLQRKHLVEGNGVAGLDCQPIDGVGGNDDRMTGLDRCSGGIEARFVGGDEPAGSSWSTSHEGPVTVGEISVHGDIDEAGRASELSGLVELGLAQLEHERSPGAKPLPRTVDQHVGIFEPGWAREQCVGRLPLGDHRGQFLVVGNVRRVRDDQVEAAFGVGVKRLEPVTLTNLDPASGSTESGRIGSGGGNGVVAGVGADDSGPRILRGDRQADTAAPGSQVSDHHISVGQAFDRCKGEVDDALGFGARNQDSSIDGQVERPEAPSAEHILQRLTGETAFEHGVEVCDASLERELVEHLREFAWLRAAGFFDNSPGIDRCELVARCVESATGFVVERSPQDRIAIVIALVHVPKARSTRTGSTRRPD
ncbi:hypothetical protein GQR58_030424 [Nymphon striatum]|nr:hypothetical protein GQR58_030424 [Nymphon striatum]